jgi:UDP-glucose 4-epimerase
MAKRVLITGGAGFIGSHLAERLHGAGDTVVVLDDLSTGREANLAGLVGKAGFRLERGTVEDAELTGRLVGEADAVFHLASAVGVQLIVDEPVRTIRTIIRGTETVLEAASRRKTPVLVTSSSEVYGKGARVPFSEDDDVVMGATRHSRWCYAYAKGIDEFLAMAYHKQFGLPAVVVRLFNTVGPRQVGQYGMVLPRFVEAAKAGRDLQVYGDGKQTRCFCHVSDVVGAIIRLMEKPEAVGSVFNLGSDEEVSIDELARRVIEITGSKSAVKYLTYEQAYGQAFDDMLRRVPDLSRVARVIGFRPGYRLDDIIRSVAGAVDGRE